MTVQNAAKGQTNSTHLHRLLIATVISFPVFCSIAHGDFTLVVLPDTQTYSQDFPDVFTSQTQWIKANKRSLNISFVLHEGDIVNDPTNVGQWENADRSMSLLDTFIPYTLAVGNHDMGTTSIHPPNNRDTTYFNTYFPFSRYDCNSWYGGHMSPDNDNHYCFVRADGINFMIVTLEFGPDDDTLAWANAIVASHPDRRVIVLTHCYMNWDNTPVGPEDPFNPHGYGIDATGTNDGEEIWDEFIKHHPNIFLVLSGHIHSSELERCTGRLTSTGVHGNSVHQLLANYQSFDADGGWLRILRFVPDEDKILVKTYSPIEDAYLVDDNNEFELIYNMPDSPLGCCCLSNNDSMIIKESDCLSIDGGLYLGDDISCAGGACPHCSQEPLQPPCLGADWIPKNKYISFEANNPGRTTAIRVTVADCLLFPELAGWRQWVGPPHTNVAYLRESPECRDWSSLDKIHVTSDIIVPESAYEIQLVDCNCPSFYSESLVVSTAVRWGDVAGMNGEGWTAPDGVADFIDLTAIVDRFRNLPGAPSVRACDLYPSLPDYMVDFQDIATGVSAFRGEPYPFVMETCRSFIELGDQPPP